MGEDEYDVCLSYAAEQRSFVEQVAGLLHSHGVRVFYDRYEQANLWGKDLYAHLDVVYRQKVRYCIVFVSADYARKVWTTHERQSAQARAFTESEEYILPVRFDDTEIPGLRPTVGYIDLRRTSPAQLVDLVAAKLNGAAVGPGPAEPAGTPLPYSIAPKTDDEQAILLSLRPGGWEYFLFAGALARGRARLEGKLRDHRLRYARRVRRISDDSEALRYIGTCMRDAIGISGDLMKILDGDAQDWAFGRPGEPGNPDNIIHLANRFTDLFEDLLDWAANLRGTVVDDRFTRLYELTARYVDLPVVQVDTFIDSYAEQLVDVPRRLANGDDIEISVALTLSVDEVVSREFDEEQDRLSRIL